MVMRSPFATFTANLKQSQWGSQKKIANDSHVTEDTSTMRDSPNDRTGTAGIVIIHQYSHMISHLMIAFLGDKSPSSTYHW